jgi:hypothetical protein
MTLKDHTLSTTVVLGAGASRSVSYAHKGGYPSPLDSDFFDLLQRLRPADEDKEAVRSVLQQVSSLPHECWRSMERAFYTLHLRAYMAEKLAGHVQVPSDNQVVAEFARCVQALLRKAHGTNRCQNHYRILRRLHKPDTVISFNYDLVPERAIRRVADDRSVEFGPRLYGLDDGPPISDLPLILKLHGSSNWRMKQNGEEDRIEIRTQAWHDLDPKPGYRGHLGEGTTFPIFLPFWEKRIEKGPWLPIWQTAFTRLRRSQRLIVWGYSLPPTDVKAQHLFAIALASKPLSLCVIDPSAGTRTRWRELLPKAKYWEYESIKDFLAQPPLWWPKTEPAGTVPDAQAK